MKVVAENSEEEVARRRAEQERARAELELGMALRELGANMLRVIRGAGRPAILGTQCQTLVDVMAAYREAVGHWPPSEEIVAALAIERPEYFDRLSDREKDRYFGERQIVRGALQAAAAGLLGQRTQERAGEHEMYGGVNEIERVREEENREFFAAQRGFSQRTRKVPSKPKRKSKG